MVQLDSVPLGNDQHSWVLTSDATTIHNGEVISRLKVKPEEGSVVVSLLGFRMSKVSCKTQVCVCVCYLNSERLQYSVLALYPGSSLFFNDACRKTMEPGKIHHMLDI